MFAAISDTANIMMAPLSSSRATEMIQRPDPRGRRHATVLLSLYIYIYNRGSRGCAQALGSPWEVVFPIFDTARSGCCSPAPPGEAPGGCWSGGGAWRSPRAGETGATRPSLSQATTAPAGVAFGAPLRGA